jgi:signal transduction histidine kinase
LKRNSSIPYAALGTFLKRLLDLRSTVAFRLTLWYAGIFTVSLCAAFLIFYTLVLQSQGISHDALAALREDVREYFGTALIIVILSSTLIGWFMARRALSGVGKITQTVIAIAEGDLDRRVPEKGQRDEIGRLARTFNAMLNRIQTLIHEMEEMTDNIAHDLRNPVARIRGIAEGILTGEGPIEERLSMAGSVIDECDHLLEMINTMLDISEAEAGLAKLHREEVNIGALTRDVCELFQPLADEKDIALTVEAPETLSVSGDLRKLQRVFANLLDNALKYAPAGGGVRVSVTADAAGVVVTVKDTGVGIPEEEIPHVFDRFYRGERSRSTPGNGLGLTLAHAFVGAHGGRITVTSRSGEGSEFVVILPRTSPPSNAPDLTKR